MINGPRRRLPSCLHFHDLIASMNQIYFSNESKLTVYVANDNPNRKLAAFNFIRINIYVSNVDVVLVRILQQTRYI